MTDLLVPQLLRRLHTDEFDAVPYDACQRAVALAARDKLPELARRLNVALLTSTPGKPGENILENGQIAAVRDVVERYAGTGRLLSHTIIHPNLGRDEIDAMEDHVRTLRPSAWKVYTMYGPPTKYAPEGGWFLDDEENGFPFLDQVMRCGGPRIVSAHKGLGGPS